MARRRRTCSLASGERAPSHGPASSQATRWTAKHHGPLTVLAARSAIALGIVVHLVAWELAGPWLGARSPEVREHDRLRRAMFRSAAAWLLRGAPLDPPRLAGATT